VLGFDTGIDYAKLTALCNAVRAGLPYIATHPDINCPVAGGVIPDVGAVIAFVQAATGRLPNVVVGKPNGIIARMAARRAGLPLSALCMVGDRLYTDIALGRAGVQTALVFSGETTRESLAQSDLKPTYVFENLAGMAAALRRAPHD
jgi:ribonucleotide monophosphatase NagD (HAD superfamily)